MEELLNKLIKRGWKPRWYEDVYEFKLYKLWYTVARPQKQKMISFATEARHYINWTYYVWYKWYSLRELVSKESWLWQFVCEMSVHNNYNKEKWKILTWKKFEDDKYQINWYSNWWWYIQDYEYWLIECALKDEDELDKFLLDNIKVDD